jgi:hypothetical protein
MSEENHEQVTSATSRASRSLKVIAVVTALTMTLIAATASAVLFMSNNDPRKNDPDLIGMPEGIVAAPQPLSSKYYKEKMTGCVETFGALQQTNWDKYINNELTPAAECVLKVFFEAADRLDIRNIITATAAQVTDTPALYLICHDMSHRAAKRAYVASGEDARLLLEQVPFRTCDDGFVHGIFDAVAHIYGADGAEFKNVMKTCVELGSDPEGKHVGTFSYSQCGDGSGHVLFARTEGDLMKTVKLCSEFLEMEIRRWCVMGAMMEKYKPYFASWTDAQEDQLVDEITTRCASWPEDMKKISGVYEGCYSAAGYLFNNVAQSHTSQILQRAYGDEAWKVTQDSGMMQPTEVIEPARKQVIEEYVSVAERCSSFPAMGQKQCFYIVAPLMPIHIRRDETLYNELCAYVREFEEVCVSTRLWGMGAF